jgi:PTH1 family peptidyl-tRNA hydrolase
MAKIQVGGEDVVVLKPLTYMNRSGDAVADAMHFYKCPIEDVIVIHDELDIPPLSFRIKRGGGHGGHNGLRSIMHLGDQFLRIRAGIGRPAHPAHEVADFVLGNLSDEEWKNWDPLSKNVCQAIDLCVEGKVEEAMNRFHRKG